MTFNLTIDSESDTPKATPRSVDDLSISFERSTPPQTKIEADSEDKPDSSTKVIPARPILEPIPNSLAAVQAEEDIVEEE